MDSYIFVIFCVFEVSDSDLAHREQPQHHTNDLGNLKARFYASRRMCIDANYLPSYSFAVLGPSITLATPHNNVPQSVWHMM